MKLKYGVALNDLSGWCSRKLDKNDVKRRLYDLWHAMLTRCYGVSRESYSDCFVCERWLKLSNFVEDAKALPNYELWLSNPHKRIMLDKDIKFKGNKVYSPETCMFVTARESNLDVFERNGCPINSAKAIKNKIESVSKSIICTFPDGREECFSSSLLAEKMYGFKHPAIAACCKGKSKTHHGCKFRYA